MLLFIHSLIYLFSSSSKAIIKRHNTPSKPRHDRQSSR